MNAVSTQITLADLERMPDDGMRREILYGELIELPPPKFGHENIAYNMQQALLRYVNERKLGRVYLGSTGYQLFADRKTWLEPDVSFLRADRVAGTGGDDYPQGAPELAVEIMSPSESAKTVKRKVAAYFEAGAQAVVLVFPKTRTVRLLLSDDRVINFRETDTLTIPSLLPGWELPVAQIFAD
ncbi:MAG TPA: Uma2 family endonuclease [Bryobacteraceae bacterium]|nr:Uma2 family endonuclease [Bryobacteraceae bacterium]